MKIYEVDIHGYRRWINRLSDPYLVKLNVGFDEFKKLKAFTVAYTTYRNQYNAFTTKKYFCFKYSCPQCVKYALVEYEDGGGWHHYQDVEKLKCIFTLVEPIDISFELQDYYKKLGYDNTGQITK